MSEAVAIEAMLDVESEGGVITAGDHAEIELEAFGPYPSQVFQGRRKRPPFAKLLFWPIWSIHKAI